MFFSVQIQWEFERVPFSSTGGGVSAVVEQHLTARMKSIASLECLAGRMHQNWVIIFLFFNAYNAAGVSRRQDQNVTNFVKNVNILKFVLKKCGVFGPSLEYVC